MNRARARCAKERAASKLGSVARLKRDVSSINKLHRLITWCSSKKINVFFDRRRNGGGYDEETKTICCNSQMRPDVQLYLLLHECGHHLIESRPRLDKFELIAAADDDPIIKRTLAHRVDIVGEELEAWHRGKQLATRLRIKINKKEYDRVRAKFLKSYMKWAVKPSDFELAKDED